MDVDQLSGATGSTHPQSRGPTPLAECAVCGQISKVRTVCVRSASTGLCGGCRVTGIPTATCSSGNVTDDVIAKYIAEQNMDQDEDFKVDG